MELKDVYTVKELAALTGMLPQSIRRLIKEGKLKAIRVDRNYFISKEDAAELIKKKQGA